MRHVIFLIEQNQMTRKDYVHEEKKKLNKILQKMCVKSGTQIKNSVVDTFAPCSYQMLQAK